MLTWLEKIYKNYAKMGIMTSLYSDKSYKIAFAPFFLPRQLINVFV